MRRLLQPFVLVVTALLAAAYAYVASRLASDLWARTALAIPFLLIWIVPVLYWSRERDDEETLLDQIAHQASYLSMAWVSFVIVLTLARDAVLLVTRISGFASAHEVVQHAGAPAVMIASFVALGLGAL